MGDRRSSVIALVLALAACRTRPYPAATPPPPDDAGLAIRDGAIAIRDGATAISDGAIAISDGAIAIRDGAIEIDDAAFAIDLAAPVDAAMGLDLACVADCGGKQCGGDGCGGSCGACASGLTCDAGRCLASCGDGSGLPVGAPWPMFGRCADHAGRSPYVGAQSASLRWAFDTGALVDGSPVIAADGTVYIGSSSSCGLFALDGASGALRWQRFDAYCAQASTPALTDDGALIVLASDWRTNTNTVSALDAATGRTRWTTPVDAVIDNTSSPTVGPGGVVYVSATDRLYALDGATGTTLWTWTAGSTGENWSAPALGGDGGLFVGSWSGRYYAVESASGMTRWGRAALCDTRLSAAAVANGTIYMGDQCYALWALDTATGGTVWRRPGVSNGNQSSPSLGADLVYATGVHAVALDGTLRWFTSASAYGSKPAVGADGTVYVGASDDDLYALDGASGAVKWQYATGGGVGSSPAIGADGTIYVGSLDGKVYAVGP